VTPVVLCLDFDSYICALGAMETIALNCPTLTDRMYVAAADFRRAHASYAMIDSQLQMPAFLRRQAE
jgi:hypothetical protein